MKEDLIKLRDDLTRFQQELAERTVTLRSATDLQFVSAFQFMLTATKDRVQAIIDKA